MLRATVLVVAVVAVLVTAATASAAPRQLDSAMQHYALCRAPSGVQVAGGISAAYHGRVTISLSLTNHASLMVYAGLQRHRVAWITSHGVREHLFRFRHLRNVPARLRAACS